MALKHLTSGRWHWGPDFAGYTVEVYESGTSTQKTTYTDSDLTAANTWPVTLDANGAAQIWFDGAAKVIVKTPLGSVYATDDEINNDSGEWCSTAGGSANAITLSPSPAITSYVAGKRFVFLSASANTGATTVAISGLTAKNITKHGSTALTAGDIPAGAVITIVYDGTQFQLDAVRSLTVGLSSGALVANASSGWIPRGHLAGLTLANNGTDATNDIDIAVGECADSTNAYILKLTSALTKQLDAAWAVGTNAGGLDTGTKAVSTWYHVFLIRKDSDGSIDALFSTSVSSPTMPTGYTYKRRIGSILTDGAGAILAFKQIGDDFLWADPPLDVNGVSEDTTADLRTISVPLGVKVEASINVMAVVAASATVSLYISSPDANDEAPSSSAAPLSLWDSSDPTTASARIGTWMRVMTNTSSQIRTRAGAASTTLHIATLGWEDARGRFD